jgi:hypothetical protein
MKGLSVARCAHPSGCAGTPCTTGGGAAASPGGASASTPLASGSSPRASGCSSDSASGCISESSGGDGDGAPTAGAGASDSGSGGAAAAAGGGAAAGDASAAGASSLAPSCSAARGSRRWNPPLGCACQTSSLSSPEELAAAVRALSDAASAGSLSHPRPDPVLSMSMAAARSRPRSGIPPSLEELDAVGGLRLTAISARCVALARLPRPGGAAASPARLGIPPRSPLE